MDTYMDEWMASQTYKLKQTFVIMAHSKQFINCNLQAVSSHI